MATLTLSAECIEAVLSHLLRPHFSAVRVLIKNDKGVIALTKFITFKFRIWCEQTQSSSRVRIFYAGSFGTGVMLALARKRILRHLPFIESIRSGECIVNLDKLVIAGAPLTVWGS